VASMLRKIPQWAGRAAAETTLTGARA